MSLLDSWTAVRHTADDKGHSTLTEHRDRAAVGQAPAFLGGKLR